MHYAIDWAMKSCATNNHGIFREASVCRTKDGGWIDIQKSPSDNDGHVVKRAYRKFIEDQNRVSNWQTCSIGQSCLNDSNSNNFQCCEAPGGDDGKLTCRPHWECSNNHLPNWKTCYSGNTCAPDDMGNEFKCCDAPGNVDNGKKTCRIVSDCA